MVHFLVKEISEFNYLCGNINLLQTCISINGKHTDTVINVSRTKQIGLRADYGSRQTAGSVKSWKHSQH